MKHLTLFLLAVFTTVLFCGGAPYDDSRRTFLIDSLSSELSVARTYSDSVSILYDLFDLRTRSKKGIDGMKLLHLSRNHGDERTELDIARRLASATASYDTIICNNLLEYVKALPPSRDRDATDLFIKLTEMRARASNSDEEGRQRKLNEYIERYRTSHNLTPTEEVEMLFVICTFMDMTVPSATLTDYIDRLGAAIDRLPFKLIGLYNMYYLDAAIAYNNYGDSAKAVEMNKKLLSIIDNLSEQSRAEGRKYRDYATHYYNTYRRFLSNYTALSDSEIEDYYSRILELASRSLDCNYDLASSQLPTIFYLMAKKRYAEALPIIKKQIHNKNSISWRRRLYRLMLEAAKATDDREAVAEAALGYSELLEDYIRQSSMARAREFATLYNIYSLEADNARLEQLNIDNEAEGRHTRVVTLFIFTIVLILVLILVAVLYYRARRLSGSLAAANAQLLEERDNLQRIQRDLIEARDRARRADRHKTDFIHNMSHEVTTPLNAIVEYSRLIVDNMSEEKRKYVEKYARIVEISSDMLRTLVNDVLEIASLESESTPVIKSSISANLLCEVAVECVKKLCKEGVKLQFTNAGEPDILVYTDSKRVEQVLINLLTNALKFTDHGFVELSLSADTTTSTVTFAVTDSGPGIPEGKEDKIFERFEKLDSTTQGLGLGLNICRMVAEMLGGKVAVDTSYTGSGSRFIFTIPMN